MVILNLILLCIAALSSFIPKRYLSQAIIALTSILLVINNIYLLSHPDSFILADFLGYQIAFQTDALSNIFVLMVSILYCATNFYSFFYLSAQETSNLGKDLHPRIHFFFMPIAIICSLAVAYSNNLMTLFIFYEVLTLSTYPLVIQSFSKSSKRAGRFYFSMLFGSSSILILFALIFIDQNYETINFKLGGIIPQDAEIKDVLLLLICFIFGFSKTAIFPLFGWLPKAMAAPVPVSALLHAVAVVKTGIFALIKVFVYIFGIDYLNSLSQISPWVISWISMLACFTIIFTGFMASIQDTLKKVLAYSTVSQLSYMILALSFVTNEAVVAAFMQMLAHSIAKITLFFVAGIIYLALHKTKINEMQQVFKSLPVAAILFAVASFSIYGMPFSIGYRSIHNIHEIIKHNDVVVICLFVSSLFSCYYYSKIIYKMLSAPEQIKEVRSHAISSLLWITSIVFSLSILLAIYFNDIVLYLSEGL